MLSKDLINYIYTFDPTYKNYFNKCINEINIELNNNKNIINNINNIFWNGSMPESVFEWHCNNWKLKFLKK